MPIDNCSFRRRRNSSKSVWDSSVINDGGRPSVVQEGSQFADFMGFLQSGNLLKVKKKNPQAVRKGRFTSLMPLPVGILAFLFNRLVIHSKDTIIYSLPWNNMKRACMHCKPLSLDSRK